MSLISDERVEELLHMEKEFERLKALLTRAADALEYDEDVIDLEFAVERNTEKRALIDELRKA